MQRPGITEDTGAYATAEHSAITQDPPFRFPRSQSMMMRDRGRGCVPAQLSLVPGAFMFLEAVAMKNIVE
jgi:hypothetical protein